MKKNIQRNLILLVAEVAVVALLVVVSQKLTASQKENTPLKTYVYDTIYFEYPGSWELTLNETATSGELALKPLAGSSEAKSFGIIYLIFLPDVPFENWEQTIAEQQTCSGHTNTLWYRLVNNEKFPGFECVWKQPEDKFPYWEFFLYNESEQFGLSILATPLNAAAVDMLSSPESAEAAFPDIIKIAESVRRSEK